MNYQTVQAEGTSTLSLNLTKTNMTVRQDYDEESIIATFAYSNGTALDQTAVIEAELTGGKHHQYFKPPVKISRINGTSWNLFFDIKSRIGFANDNYTMNFIGLYNNEKIIVPFTLIILFNEDLIEPSVLLTHTDGTLVQGSYSFLHGETFQVNLHVKDNRAINYYSLWNTEKQAAAVSRGTFGESPINLTDGGATLFTNKTDIIYSNFTLEKDSFLKLAPLEGGYTFSILAEDMAGNKVLGNSFSISIDNFPPKLQLQIPDKAFDPEKEISISWIYEDKNPKNPLEFDIEIDTDNDFKVDTILATKYPQTDFSFYLPTNWTVPELDEVDKVTQTVYLQIKVTTSDKYGNFNSQEGIIGINISKFISSSELNDNQDISGNPVSPPKSNQSGIMWYVVGAGAFILGPLAFSPANRYLKKGNIKNKSAKNKVARRRRKRRS